MGKTRLLLSGILLLTLSYTATFSQDSISITSNELGLVEYNINLTDSKSHVFVLYGDGTFGIQQSPVHKFQPDSSGYETEAYIVKPYKPNPPPKKSVSTGGTGEGSTHINPDVRMSGEIDLMTSWAPAKDYENFFIVAFKNINSTNPVNGCVEFYYDSVDISVNTSLVKIYNEWVYNQTDSSGSYGNFNMRLAWKFDSLAYNETRYIYVPATVNIKAGKKLKLQTKYKVDCTGSGSSADYDFLVRRYPHDPNFKIVDKECLNTNMGIQHLEYTVGFFNDGDTVAQDIYLIDILSPNLDATSLEIIDYEYAPLLSFMGSETHFDFLGINLPGTKQTSPEAYSYDDAFTYLKFGICTLPPFITGMCIENQVEIIFDTQSPYLTDPAVVCYTEGCMDYLLCDLQRQKIDSADNHDNDRAEGEGLFFEAYPNPFGDELKVAIDFKEAINMVFSINLVDLTGKTVQRLYESNADFGTFEKQFYLDDLPKGIYFIILQTDRSVYSKKIIKQ